MQNSRTVAQGFTLVELLVVMAIVAVLAAIALPTFTESVRKARRADAVMLLTGIQQSQERFRANNASYASTLEQLTGAPRQTDHYVGSISGAGAAGYTVTATARSNSPQSSDTACRVMSLRMTAGGNVVYMDADEGSSRCWVR